MGMEDFCLSQLNYPSRRATENQLYYGEIHINKITVQ